MAKTASTKTGHGNGADPTADQALERNEDYKPDDWRSSYQQPDWRSDHRPDDIAEPPSDPRPDGGVPRSPGVGLPGQQRPITRPGERPYNERHRYKGETPAGKFDVTHSIKRWRSWI